MGHEVFCHVLSVSVSLSHTHTHRLELQWHVWYVVSWLMLKSGGWVHVSLPG